MSIQPKNRFERDLDFCLSSILNPNDIGLAKAENSNNSKIFKHKPDKKNYKTQRHLTILM